MQKPSAELLAQSVVTPENPPNSPHTEEEECKQETPPVIDPSVRARLVEKLQMIASKDASIVTKKIDMKLQNKIDKMDVDELRVRIQQYRAKASNRISSTVNKKVINVLDAVVGSAFGCKEELTEMNENDKLLQDSTNEILGDYLLFVPAHIKSLGLYAMNLSMATAQARSAKKAESKSGIPDRPDVVEK